MISHALNAQPNLGGEASSSALDPDADHAVLSQSDWRPTFDLTDDLEEVAGMGDVVELSNSSDEEVDVRSTHGVPRNGSDSTGSKDAVQQKKRAMRAQFGRCEWCGCAFRPFLLVAAPFRDESVLRCCGCLQITQPSDEQLARFPKAALPMPPKEKKGPRADFGFCPRCNRPLTPRLRKDDGKPFVGCRGFKAHLFI